MLKLPAPILSLVAACCISRDYFHNSLLAFLFFIKINSPVSQFGIDVVSIYVEDRGITETTKHYTLRVNIYFHVSYFKVLKVRTQDRFRSKASPCWPLWFIRNGHRVVTMQVTEGS